MEIRILESHEATLHDTIASHPLQSWAWGEFRTSTGQEVLRIGGFDDGKLVETHQMTLHAIPFTPWKVAYCPRGKQPSQEMLDGIRRITSRKGALFVKFEPDVSRALGEDGKPLPEEGEDPALFLEQCGLKKGKSLFTRYSFILDLSPGEDQLLASCASKTRYNIRLAVKKGVTVRENTTQEGLDDFLTLLEETTNRQGFYAHNRSYYRKMFDILQPLGNYRILQACLGDEVLTTWILFIWNDTLYYPYGASSTAHREVMANNLIMWEAIRTGKALGLSRFDMWGCMEPNPDESDPWFGFHRFKKGYGPVHHEFEGTWDLVNAPVRYRLYQVAEMLRWKILRLLKRGS